MDDGWVGGWVEWVGRWVKIYFKLHLVHSFQKMKTTAHFMNTARKFPVAEEKRKFVYQLL